MDTIIHCYDVRLSAELGMARNMILAFFKLLQILRKVMNFQHIWTKGSKVILLNLEIPRIKLNIFIMMFLTKPKSKVTTWGEATLTLFLSCYYSRFSPNMCSIFINPPQLYLQNGRKHHFTRYAVGRSFPRTWLLRLSQGGLELETSRIRARWLNHSATTA